MPPIAVGTPRLRSLARWAAVGLTIGLIACERAGGAEAWIDERASGPFVCRAEFPLVQFDGLMRDLAALQRDLTQSLRIEPAREPMEVLLFGGEASYRAFLRARYPQFVDRPALYVKGNGPGQVLVFRGKDLAVNVRHESTHALLHASLPMVPLWLDEGLAEYFEVPPRERAYGNPNLSKLKWGLYVGQVPHLADLERKHELNDLTATDYRYAWAWVHFMLHGPPEARDELVRYLADIHSSTPPGLLSERLERRLPGVEKRLVQHFKTWKQPTAAKPPLLSRLKFWTGSSMR